MAADSFWRREGKWSSASLPYWGIPWGRWQLWRTASEEYGSVCSISLQENRRRSSDVTVKRRQGRRQRLQPSRSACRSCTYIAHSLRAGLKEVGRTHSHISWNRWRAPGARRSCDKGVNTKVFHVSSLHRRRLTLEEVVFCVLVGVVRAADDVERRAARHHLKHQHAERPPVHAEAWNTERRINGTKTQMG